MHVFQNVHKEIKNACSAAWTPNLNAALHISLNEAMSLNSPEELVVMAMNISS